MKETIEQGREQDIVFDTRLKELNNQGWQKVVGVFWDYQIYASGNNRIAISKSPYSEINYKFNPNN